MESQAAVYHDFSGFSHLRARVREGAEGATRDVASQFESIFIQIMLKSMRDTVPEGGLFDSSQMTLYQEMFDQQISLDMARRGGIGLADIIEQQLGIDGNLEHSDVDEASAVIDGGAQGAEANPFNTLKLPPRQNAFLQEVSIQAVPTQALSSQVETPDPVISASVPVSPAGLNLSAQEDLHASPATRLNADANSPDKHWMPSGPAEFVGSVRQYAVRAAAELGVSENLLIAQVVLETGWGQKIIQNRNGENSFNLFGIKAGGDWQGDRVNRLTLEYKDGVAQKQPAQFRSYSSIGDSFEDYVTFLRSNPRYDRALGAVGGVEVGGIDDANFEGVSRDEYFAKQLQAAGYATDPGYASKILAIKQRLDAESSAVSTVLAFNQQSRSDTRVEMNKAL